VSNIDDIPIELPYGKSQDRERQLIDFGKAIVAYTEAIGIHLSPRGWGYVLEDKGKITKDRIDRVEKLIGECLDKGYIPVDLIARDERREAQGVDAPTDCSPKDFLRRWLSYVQRCERWYTPDWFAGMDYYEQMMVEKIDLLTLFNPITDKYHIPIANDVGWSARLQRIDFGQRFKEAEAHGLQCVLLYAGDYSPADVMIFNNLKKNYEDVRHVVWSDGTTGYDPKNLIVKRFALTEAQITDFNLPWIGNLRTSSKKGLDLAHSTHKRHEEAWVQDWLRIVGPRKVEANALVTHPVEAKKICEDAIVHGVPAVGKNDVVIPSEEWLGIGEDALPKFEAKKHKIDNEINDLRVQSGLGNALHRWTDFLAKEE
jgi:hypothetical protein